MKVLGPQWEQSIVIIKLLCLSSLLYPVIAYNINIEEKDINKYNSLEEIKEQFDMLERSY